jgi:hypothetical protein
MAKIDSSGVAFRVRAIASAVESTTQAGSGERPIEHWAEAWRFRVNTSYQAGRSTDVEHPKPQVVHVESRFLS